MTKEQAIAFINALNAVQQYIPPILFAPLANSDAVKITLAVGNGDASVEVKSILKS